MARPPPYGLVKFKVNIAAQYERRHRLMLSKTGNSLGKALLHLWENLGEDQSMTSFGNLLLGILPKLALLAARARPGRAGNLGKPIQLVQTKRAVEAPSGTSTSPA